ncbi:unnamed protein product [Staurois parvus]|uniref:Uncharacterized protein n=1 Tax=Staurois parvus TaxID=386267 RepID=A0ABN9CB07_9NEOB|nr:unnamed protein product [Staurois parvus]
MLDHWSETAALSQSVGVRGGLTIWKLRHCLRAWGQ